MKHYHVDALILYLRQHIRELERACALTQQNTRITREMILWKKVQRLAKKIYCLYDTTGHHNGKTKRRKVDTRKTT